MLAPNPLDAIQQMTDLVNTRASVAGWNQALLNCVIPPLSPLPDWYTKINGLITAAQSDASLWVNNQGPEAFATLTQGYVDYSNRFDATVAALQPLVSAALSTAGQPTPAQLKSMQILVSALKTTADQIQQRTSAVLAQLRKSRAGIEDMHQTLSEALEKAQAQAGEDAQKIESLRRKVADIQSSIAVLSSKVSADDIGAGKSMVTGVIGLTFGLGISGLTLGVGTIAALVVAVAGSAVSSVMLSNQLKSQLNEYVELASSLAEEQMQLALVQSVIGSLSQLQEANSLGESSATTATALWENTSSSLEWLLVVLDQPQIDVTRIPALNDLNQAAVVWRRIAGFAQQSQDVQLTMQTIPLPETVIAPKLSSVAR